MKTKFAKGNKRPGRPQAQDKSPRQIVEEFLESHNCKVCNCASCGTELLSLKTKVDLGSARPRAGNLPETMAGRIDGRPYCSRCAK